MEEEKNGHHQVSIYIDRKEHKSPNPTVGSALYSLGKVAASYDLYEEEPGPIDDKLIPNDGREIKLKEWTHFYSAQRDLNPGAGE